MSGYITKATAFPWVMVDTRYLGLRPFNGQHKLSEFLVKEHASFDGEIDVIDGRKAYVVGIKRPGKTSFTRVWIDRERGMPIRYENYDRHPDSSGARLISEVKTIELHQLPNSGWFPVKGMRIMHRRSPKPHLSFNHTIVDVNSITIKRKDIPDSLFKIEFPEEAKVHNAITGVTTKGGKVADPRLEDVIDDSIEKLDDSNIESENSSPSEQAPDEPPPNAPVSSTEKSTDTLADVMPTIGRRSYTVWIILSAFFLRLP